MNILFVTPSYFPALVYGGPSRTVHQLALALGEAGATVRVLTTDANGAERLDVAHDDWHALAPTVSVQYCRRTLRETGSLELLARLPQALQWADVVHLQAVYSSPTPPTLALASALNKPLIWSPRGAFGHWRGTRKPALKALWRRLCRGVKPTELLLHAASELERDDILQRLPDARVVVVPNGVTMPEPALVRTPPAINAKPDYGAPLRLLFLGRLAPIKGIERLLQACSLLKLERPFLLTIAGSGEPQYERQLRSLVAELQLGEHVKFAGFVSGQLRRACFEQADISVVPSHREGFGMVVAESLAHGVPVIASEETPWKTLDARGCGIWVNAEPTPLSRAIATLARQPLIAMGKRGQSWMQQQFGWDTIAQRFLASYRNLSQ